MNTTRHTYRTDPAVLDVEARTPAVGARLPAGWIKEATAAVEAFGPGDTFTSGTLRAVGVSEPPHPAHWGGLLGHLRAEGVIENAGLRIERIPCGESRPVRVWRRTYGGQEAA